MLFYIVAVAVLNLGLGFAAAVYLSRRCRQAKAEATYGHHDKRGPASAASPFGADSEQEVSPGRFAGAFACPPDGGEIAPAEDIWGQDEVGQQMVREQEVGQEDVGLQAASQNEIDQRGPDQEELDEPKLGRKEPLQEVLEEEDCRQPDAADFQEETSQIGSSSVGQGEPCSSAEPPRVDRHSEAFMKMDEFQDRLGQYHQQPLDFDDQLRGHAAASDSAGFQSALNSLRTVNQQYLESGEQVHEAFEQPHNGPQQFQAFRDNLQSPVDPQTEQIPKINDTKEELNCQADLQKGRQQVVRETTKLLEANHHLRDTFDEALLVVARNEHRWESVDEASRADTLTGLSNRRGLETDLARWWEEDPRRVRQLCVAMIDLDHFRQVNERYGHKAGDRVLQTIARFLAAETRHKAIAARFSGQRFVLLFADTDLRSTTNVTERIRQLVQKTHFQYQEAEIRVTISCGVTEATSEDTSEALYARTEATLKEAKRYGRNRTFLHEGRYPTPVVPPSFSLPEKSITI